jgi:hypothetical protein
VRPFQLLLKAKGFSCSEINLTLFDYSLSKRRIKRCVILLRTQATQHS